MRLASICAVSALALGFVHSHALAQSSPPPTPQPTISEREEVRNTYIFKFNPRVPRAAMAGIAHRVVGEAGGTVRHVYTNVLGGFAATLPGAAVWNVAGAPEIISYERDQIFTIAAPPWCDDNPDHNACKDDDGGDDGDDDDGDSDDSDGENGASDKPLDCLTKGTMPWGVEYVRNDTVPATDSCGEGIHVYVLDTGIDLDHPNLTPVGKSVDCTKGCGSGGDDKNGHGTHVAGSIGARGNGNSDDVLGVSPAVHLHSVQVLKPGGTGSMSDIIDGIDYVADQAINLDAPVVANMSLGGSGSKDGECSSSGFTGSGSLHHAMCDAAQEGVVFVVAAGNSGADAESFVPAAYDDVAIAVSATNSSNDWPSWSNYGNDPADWLPTEEEKSAPVAVAAPGVSIVSTQIDGGTTSMSGTSMASPHVAGVAALLLQADTGITANYSAFLNIRDAMLALATKTKDNKTFANTSGHPHDERFACAVDNCPPTPTQ
ncbi:MAG: S8 family serine peptidase [bacterium]